MSQINPNTNRLRFLAVLFFTVISFSVFSATYYLTDAGKGSAQSAASWNTNPDGSGTPATDFGGDGDEFNVPLGRDGIVSANWILNDGSPSNGTIFLTVNGSLTFNSGVVFTLQQQNQNFGINIITVSGTLVFLGTGASQIVGEKNATNNRLTLQPGSKIITANTSGVAGTGNQSIKTTLINLVLDNAANFEFSGAAQSMAGLPSTVNDLILSGSGAKTMASGITINGYLSVRNTATLSLNAQALSFGNASTIEYKNTGDRTTGIEFPASFAGAGGVVVDPGDGFTVSLNQDKTALSNIHLVTGNFDLLTYNVNRATSGGTLSIAGGASLKIGGTNTISTNYSIPIIACAGTVEYYGSNQTIRSFNYGNLILSGSGVKTLQSGTTSICNDFTVSGTASATGVTGITIGNNVTIGPGATFTAGAYTHNIAGELLIDPSATFNSANSTINFNGADAKDIYAGTFHNLVFSGFGVKSAVGNLNITGNLTITSNFDAGSYTHQIAGDFINNGIFTDSTSTIEFVSSIERSVQGTSLTSFHNLRVNGTGGVALSSYTRIDGTLTLTEGTVRLGSHNLKIQQLSGGSASSYVVTDGIGVLKRNVIGGGDPVVFPVGNSSFNAITITNATVDDEDEYGVKVIDGTISSVNDDTKIVNRKWQITEATAGGSALTLDFRYNSGETASNFNASLSPVIGYYTGTHWAAPLSATVQSFVFSSDSAALVVDDLTGTDDFLCIGSEDAFSASKLAVLSVIPGTPFANQQNVSVRVQSQNSQSIATNVVQNTSFDLTVSNTSFSTSPTDTIYANTSETTVSSLAFSAAGTDAVVTATRSSGDILSAGNSTTFNVVSGTLYKPNTTPANWSAAIWLSSSDGGTTWTDTPVSKTSFNDLDAIIIPTNYALNANTSASFYNLTVDSGAVLDIITGGTLTLNHSGSEDGFNVYGTLRNSGGILTNTNTSYPVVLYGGTYIHNRSGQVIPVISWNSQSGNNSVCEVLNVPSGGFDQSFQDFTLNSGSNITIDGNMTVSGELTLTSAVLITGGYRVNLLATAHVTSGDGWVHGNIRSYVPNASSPVVEFPIGDANHSSPVSITFSGSTTGSGYLDATTQVIAPPYESGISQTAYINRKWTLTASGIESYTSYSATFHFANVDKIGSPDTDVLFVRRLTLATNTWSSVTMGARTSGSTQSTGMTEFGSFVIGENECTATNAFWLGSVSRDWHTGGNWCSGDIPTSAKNVVIPAGTANQPIISTTSTAAVCNQLTVMTGASLEITGSNLLYVHGVWNMEGDFITNEGTVIFSGTSIQQINDSSTFYNLTINNATGVVSNVNLLVENILDIVSTNPSVSQGAFHFPSPKTLTMGSGGTTYGIGDVTGTIRRDYFVTQRDYSFGNRYSRIYFNENIGQTLPSEIRVTVSLGTAPDWSSYSGDTIINPLKRIYFIEQTGGDATSATVKLHYKDNEYVVGLNESRLSVWTLIDNVVSEFGQVQIDVTNNYVMIEGFEFQSTIEDFYFTVAPRKAPLLYWVGGAKQQQNQVWNNPENWNPQYIPSSEYRVRIPNRADDPILPAGAHCVSIEILTGAILYTASNASLTLYGDWVNQAGVGGFVAGNSLITINGASTLKGTTNFNDLVVVDGASITAFDNSYTTISGNFSLSTSGSLNAGSIVNTFEFNSADSTWIPGANDAQTGFYNLTFSNTGVKVLPAELNIKGNFTNNSTTVNAMMNSSTVIMAQSGVQSIAGSTAMTLNNLTLGGSGLKNISTTPTVNGVFSLEGSATVINPVTYGSNSTLQYKGTVSRTTASEFPDTLVGSGGLIIDEGTDTIAFSETKTISNGELKVLSGVLDLGEYQLLGSLSNVVNNGLIQTQNTDTLAIPSGLVWSGTGTLRYHGVDPQILVAGDFHRIIIDNDLTLDAGTTVIARDTLRINEDKSLAIVSGQKVKAKHIKNLAGVDGLFVGAGTDSLPNASLIFHNPYGSPVEAVVQMYSKAFYDPMGPEGSKYKWQFFGIPLRSLATASPTFDGSYVRRYREYGTEPTALWEQLSNSSSLSPFEGYEITQNQERYITFSGTLENSDFSRLLAYTPEATYPGQHILSNSYTAAIDIKKLGFGDSLDAAVYMYNTGSFSDWESGVGVSGEEPGQYIVIPQNLAGLGGLPSHIPSMQGYLIRAFDDPGTDRTFLIDYDSVMIENTDPQRVKPMKAAQQETVYSIIEVSGGEFSDRLWFFPKQGAPGGFYNGWDGRKLMVNGKSPQIFSQETDGDYQVNTLNDMHQSVIGFRPGEAVDYLMTISHIGMDRECPHGLYLIDYHTLQVVDISHSGTQYSFKAEAYGEVDKRFKIVTSLESIYEEKEKLSAIQVYVAGQELVVQNISELSGQMIVYDHAGRNLMQADFQPGETRVRASLPRGMYIVRTITDHEERGTKVLLP